ncbi:MAG: hypothetical protein BWY82_01371 [Verrucomicrobia bacterium ADurb.Bin474]|nr:MAG: hypothetical protein BWY82_01371 [Verrucomicrobia bacterium ADurb.Bin474]
MDVGTPPAPFVFQARHQCGAHILNDRFILLAETLKGQILNLRIIQSQQAGKHPQQEHVFALHGMPTQSGFQKIGDGQRINLRSFRSDSIRLTVL